MNEQTGTVPFGDNGSQDLKPGSLAPEHILLTYSYEIQTGVRRAQLIPSHLPLPPPGHTHVTSPGKIAIQVKAIHGRYQGMFHG